MKQSPKTNVAARIDERTKWILQEVAKVKKQTLSELISDILDDAVNNSSDLNIKIIGVNFNGMYYRAFREEYDNNVTKMGDEEYSITELKEEIENINVSALRPMLSDVHIILDKIETMRIVGRLSEKEARETAALVNDKCREIAGRDVINIQSPPWIRQEDVSE